MRISATDATWPMHPLRFLLPARKLSFFFFTPVPWKTVPKEARQDRSRSIAHIGHFDTHPHTYTYENTMYLQINLLIVFRRNEIVGDRNRLPSRFSDNFVARVSWRVVCKAWEFMLASISISDRKRRTRKGGTHIKHTRTCAGREQFRKRVDVYKRIICM